MPVHVGGRKWCTVAPATRHAAHRQVASRPEPMVDIPAPARSTKATPITLPIERLIEAADRLAAAEENSFLCA